MARIGDGCELTHRNRLPWRSSIRHQIGHNRSRKGKAMSTALVLSGANAIRVEIPAESLTRKTEALATAAAVQAVTDAATQQQAASALRSVQSLLKAVEDSRQQIKAPVLQAGRDIDATAKDFASPLEKEKARLGNMLAAFEAAERRKAQEAERQRQAEMARIEAERQKAEREAQEAERRRQEEAQRIERERQAAERAADSARLAEIERQQRKAAAEAQRQQQAEAVRQADILKQQAAHRATLMNVLPFPQPKPQGMVVRERFDFDVLDVHELYKFDPSLVRIEPNRQEILKRINAEKEPLRKCPALVIVPEVKVGVRA
jgi:chromosome segregation ATPase